MKTQLLCGLDIGNSKLSAIVARIRKDSLTVVGAETGPVHGMANGVIVDTARLVQSIQELTQRLYFKTGKRIKRVRLSIGGDYFHARSSFATLALSETLNRHITLSDINYLRQQARLLASTSEESILHEYSQDFLLDDQHPTLNPLGLMARKVQLHSYLLSAERQPFNSLIAAVEQAGIGVVAAYFSPIAASMSVLTIEERERGVLVVDMGATHTNLLFFKNSMVCGFKSIAFGGNAMTHALANVLETPFALADDIKKTSLVVAAQEPNAEDTIVIRKEGSYQTIARHLLSAAVKDPLEQFLSQLKEAIAANNWKEQVHCGIVGIGGSAQVEGMLERIEAATGLSVRLGHIRRAYYNNSALSLHYAAAIGALECSVHGESILGAKNYLEGRTNLERARNFVRYLYYEYF